jgi:hypothetical protein
MSIIEVAVPMMRGRRRFHVEKGRRWSVIEHLMLEAVNRAPSTTAQLSQQSKLHRRIVVEAFIRLMRVGWVEILGDTRATVFSATPAGRSQIESGGLKDVTTVRPRPMSLLSIRSRDRYSEPASFPFGSRTESLNPRKVTRSYSSTNPRVIPRRI